MYAHIWAYVFGHNSAILGPIGLENFMGTQESYDAYFWFLIFGPLLEGKKESFYNMVEALIFLNSIMNPLFCWLKIIAKWYNTNMA